MGKEEVFNVITRHLREVVPGLEGRLIQMLDSMKELGANSIDRSEVVMMTLDSLSLNIPLMETAKAENIGDLARILHAKLQLA